MPLRGTRIMDENAPRNSGEDARNYRRSQQAGLRAHCGEAPCRRRPCGDISRIGGGQDDANDRRLVAARPVQGR